VIIAVWQYVCLDEAIFTFVLAILVILHRLAHFLFLLLFFFFLLFFFLLFFLIPCSSFASRIIEA